MVLGVDVGRNWGEDMGGDGRGAREVEEKKRDVFVFVVACCFLLLADFLILEIHFCLILFLTSSYVHVMANSLERRRGRRR